MLGVAFGTCSMFTCIQVNIYTQHFHSRSMQYCSSRRSSIELLDHAHRPFSTAGRTQVLQFDSGARCIHWRWGLRCRCRSPAHQLCSLAFSARTPQKGCLWAIFAFGLAALLLESGSCDTWQTSGEGQGSTAQSDWETTHPRSPDHIEKD